MTPRLSIIIPAYNVARFLQRGLSSLLGQTCRDFEIILVDDGSTDGVTPCACDKAAECDNRIRVIHKPNGGPGSARNAGIDASRGDYIGFFDIDDIAHDDMVEKCLVHIGDSRSDMLVFSYSEISAGNRRCDFRFAQSWLRSNDEIKDSYIDTLMGENIPNGFVWNKIYRRQFLNQNNLRFTDDAIQQDEIFNLSCYADAQSLMTVSDILYDYYVYESGNNRSHYIENRLEIYRHVRDAFRQLAAKWHLEDRRLDRYADRRFMLGVFTCLDRNISHLESPLDKKERRRAVESILRDKDVMQASVNLSKADNARLDLVSKAYLSAVIHKSHMLVKAAQALSRTKEMLRKAVRFLR